MRRTIVFVHKRSFSARPWGGWRSPLVVVVPDCLPCHWLPCNFLPLWLYLTTIQGKSNLANFTGRFIMFQIDYKQTQFCWKNRGMRRSSMGELRCSYQSIVSCDISKINSRGASNISQVWMTLSNILIFS